MNKKYDSLLEIALSEMEKKRSSKPLSKIAKDVFEVKGIDAETAKTLLPQFEIDFMLSGYFICCGEDPKSGEKLWDLKNRKPSSLLDKEGNSLDDPYDDDEDVKNNELSDDTQYEVEDPYDDKNDDEEDDELEHDDIAEELENFNDDDDHIKCMYCNALISPEETVCPVCNHILGDQ